MTNTATDVGGADAAAALNAAQAWGEEQLLGYHHPRFQEILTRVLGDEFRCLVVEARGRGLCGVLPYRRAETPHGVLINAFPFFGCNGAVLTAPAVGNGIAERLVAGFKQLARHGDVLSAVLYTPFKADPTPLIDILAPDDVLLKFTQCLEVSALNAWPAKRQGDLRRAQQRGFHVRAGTRADAATVIGLHEENCASAGIPPKPRSFIEASFILAEDLGERSPLRWLVAEKEGHVAAALLYGQGPRTASYILPCAAREERAHQPNAFLMDAAIARARAAGVRYWNFESSPQWEGPVFKFKKRWGAQTSPFAVCVLYGRAGERPAPTAIAAARGCAPYYFIAPVGTVSGLWPASAGGSFPYARLRPQLSASETAPQDHQGPGAHGLGPRP